MRTAGYRSDADCLASIDRAAAGQVECCACALNEQSSEESHEASGRVAASRLSSNLNRASKQNGAPRSLSAQAIELGAASSESFFERRRAGLVGRCLEPRVTGRSSMAPDIH